MCTSWCCRAEKEGAMRAAFSVTSGADSNNGSLNARRSIQNKLGCWIIVRPFFEDLVVMFQSKALVFWMCVVAFVLKFQVQDIQAIFAALLLLHVWRMEAVKGRGKGGFSGKGRGPGQEGTALPVFQQRHKKVCEVCGTSLLDPSASVDGLSVVKLQGCLFFFCVSVRVLKRWDSEIKTWHTSCQILGYANTKGAWFQQLCARALWTSAQAMGKGPRKIEGRRTWVSSCFR